jgi:hypothetical protein
MNQPMTNTLLEQENLSYRGRGGTSAENRPLGFRPAFMDTETGAIHVSCFANGTPAEAGRQIDLLFRIFDGDVRPELILQRGPQSDPELEQEKGLDHLAEARCSGRIDDEGHVQLLRMITTPVPSTFRIDRGISHFQPRTISWS